MLQKLSIINTYCRITIIIYLKTNNIVLVTSSSTSNLFTWVHKNIVKNYVNPIQNICNMKSTPQRQDNLEQFYSLPPSENRATLGASEFFHDISEPEPAPTTKRKITHYHRNEEWSSQGEAGKKRTSSNVASTSPRWAWSWSRTWIWRWTTWIFPLVLQFKPSPLAALP